MRRIAIATGAHAKASETQIVFHIERIFGGAKAVLAIQRGDPNPFALPVLILRDSTGPFKLWSALWRRIGSIRSSIVHGTSRVPYGNDRRRMAAFLRENAIDAVLCEFGTVAIGLAPVIRNLGIPVFTYYRGADVSGFLNSKRRINGYRNMMPHLDGVFSVSAFLLEKLADHGIVHPNSFVVPSGVDTDVFLPALKDPNRCLAVGRFIEKKRPDVTVRSFCNVARNHPDAVLEMIGDGPMLVACRRIAQEANMGERVIFHGQKPHSFVKQRMAGCAIFLQHSVTSRDGNTEGLPTSVQEAMSCGMVVVSTRHAGIPEAVEEGQTGYLVDEGDEVAFSSVIDQTLRKGADLAAMSKRAREVAVARFDRSRLLNVVETAISEVCRISATQKSG